MGKGNSFNVTLHRNPKEGEDHRRRITKAVTDSQQSRASQHCREDKPRLEASARPAQFD
jgi:hypothetical protein